MEGYDDVDAIKQVSMIIADDDVAQAQEQDEDDEDDTDDVDGDLELDEVVAEAEDWVFHSDYSESEESSEVEEEEEEEESAGAFSPDGSEWNLHAEVVGRRPSRNILTQRDGFQRGLHPQTRLDAFYVVFEGILDSTVTYTNIAGRRLARKKGFQWKKTDRVEMEAFLGLHILAGALKAHHRCLRELYDLRDGIPLFRAAMSEGRFEQLKACLRFDDPVRRNPDDRAAPAGTLLQQFNEKMLKIYTPGENITIDEMLVEFHGCVSFRQYIPSKPGKFGLKMYWVAEADTAIPLRCLLYVGRSTVSEASREEHGGHVQALVMELMEPFLDSGRNLTTDNWFTSKKLALKLIDRRTTLVGTLKNNSPCIPAPAKTTEGRVRGDSVHFYSTSTTICSFWDKGSRPVNVLSSMHGAQRNCSADEGKSEIVKFYNATKSGVDILDKLVRGYSSKRKYRRWPCHVFFTLVDCSVYVAYMMRKLTTENQEGHYFFKVELAYELVLPLVRCRSEMPCLRSWVKEAMKLVGVQPMSAPHSSHPGGTVGRCAFCPREMDRKSKTCCSSCGKFICGDHQIVCCSECR
jgi:hypothetical protein